MPTGISPRFEQLCSNHLRGRWPLGVSMPTGISPRFEQGVGHDLDGNQQQFQCRPAFPHDSNWLSNTLLELVAQRFNADRHFPTIRTSYHGDTVIESQLFQCRPAFPHDSNPLRPWSIVSFLFLSFQCRPAFPHDSNSTPSRRKIT